MCHEEVGLRCLNTAVLSLQPRGIGMEGAEFSSAVTPDGRLLDVSLPFAQEPALCLARIVTHVETQMGPSLAMDVWGINW